MKIKKSKAAPAGGAGGAAIADRFKLDAPSGPAYKGPTIGKTASLVALIAGFISLALVASVTVLLYLHWVFLMPA